MKRRDFLQTAVGATAGLAIASRVAGGGNAYGAGPWDHVRDDFLLAPDRIYLNVGTLGAQPRIVVEAVCKNTTQAAESFPTGVKWDDINATLARIIGCDPAGLSFTRNTTEAMNFIANGIELNAGDQVITTNHEHIGGLCCWQLVSKRRGVTLTQVDISPAPQSPEQVYKQLTSAVTTKTKVISVSHVNFTTGFIMPVRELAQYCRSRGIIFVIDGAHPPGLMRVNISEIDPDFYASSPHKWLLAPQGTGMLYMRKEWRTKLWPTLASGDWDKLELGAQRFNHLGTIDESRFAGLQAALAYHNKLGADAVYARIAELREHLIAELKKIRRVHMVSPVDARAAGLTSFTFEGMPALELQKKLGEKNVRTRVISEYNYGYMRLSPHVYTSFGEIEKVAEMIRAV